MSRCSKIEPIVKDILTTKPYTRGDDFMLVYEVYKTCLPNEISDFNDIMVNHKEYGLPALESISRARRKLQSKFPDLLPPKEIQKLREKEEISYREYALS